jgi:hypothetical protein
MPRVVVRVSDNRGHLHRRPGSDAEPATSCADREIWFRPSSVLRNKLGPICGDGNLVLLETDAFNKAHADLWRTGDRHWSKLIGCKPRVASVLCLGQVAGRGLACVIQRRGCAEDNTAKQ